MIYKSNNHKTTSAQTLDEASQQAITLSSKSEDTEKNESSTSVDKEDIVKELLNTGIELFHDQNNVPHARVELTDGRKTYEIESAEFVSWLERSIYMMTESIPSKQFVESIQRRLSFVARFDSQGYSLSVRVTKKDGAIWIDLDGTRAVKVTPGAWELVENPPILFRYFNHQEAMPVPVKGGSLAKILDFVNVKDPRMQVMYLCFLVAAFVPEIPIAMMVINGPYGSAKTTLLKLTRTIIDPVKPLLQGRLNRPMDFAQIASQHRMLAFDNLSDLTDEKSDILCGAVTGDGDIKRKLYTDNASVTAEYRNVIGMTGINLLVERPDILSRSLIFTLPNIDEGSMLCEEEIYPEFEAALPEILGGIFDALAKALVIKDTIKINRKSRMADFVTYAASAAEALGIEAEVYLTAYRENAQIQHDVVFESEPFAQAIVKLMESIESWASNATDLLEALKKPVKELELDVQRGRWPNGANKVHDNLKQVTQALRNRGIEWWKGTGADRRKYFLKKIDVNHDGIVNGIDTLKTASVAGCDDHDGNDSTISKLKSRLSKQHNPDPVWEELYLEYMFGVNKTEMYRQDRQDRL